MAHSIRYDRRAVGDREIEGAVVYAVRTAGIRQDPVPALGEFPPPWSPTSLPGQLLATNQDGAPLIAPCLVQRAQFRHYTALTEAEARAGWSALVEAIRAGARDVDPR